MKKFRDFEVLEMIRKDRERRDGSLIEITADEQTLLSAHNDLVARSREEFQRFMCGSDQESAESAVNYLYGALVNVEAEKLAMNIPMELAWKAKVNYVSALNEILSEKGQSGQILSSLTLPVPSSLFDEDAPKQVAGLINSADAANHNLGRVALDMMGSRKQKGSSFMQCLHTINEYRLVNNIEASDFEEVVTRLLPDRPSSHWIRDIDDLDSDKLDIRDYIEANASAATIENRFGEVTSGAWVSLLVPGDMNGLSSNPGFANIIDTYLSYCQRAFMYASSAFNDLSQVKNNLATDLLSSGITDLDIDIINYSMSIHPLVNEQIRILDDVLRADNNKALAHLAEYAPDILKKITRNFAEAYIKRLMSAKDKNGNQILRDQVSFDLAEGRIKYNIHFRDILDGGTVLHNIAAGVSAEYGDYKDIEEAVSGAKREWVIGRANQNIQDHKGRTALHNAMNSLNDENLSYRVTVSRLLLFPDVKERNVWIDPNIQDNEGKTALEYLLNFYSVESYKSRDLDELATILLKVTDLSLQNNQGETIWDKAVNGGNIRVIEKLLLAKDANGKNLIECYPNDEGEMLVFTNAMRSALTNHNYTLFRALCETEAFGYIDDGVLASGSTLTLIQDALNQYKEVKGIADSITRLAYGHCLENIERLVDAGIDDEHDDKLADVSAMVYAGLVGQYQNNVASLKDDLGIASSANYDRQLEPLAKQLSSCMELSNSGFIGTSLSVDSDKIRNISVLSKPEPRASKRGRDEEGEVEGHVSHRRRLNEEVDTSNLGR